MKKKSSKGSNIWDRLYMRHLSNNRGQILLNMTAFYRLGNMNNLHIKMSYNFKKNYIYFLL